MIGKHFNIFHRLSFSCCLIATFAAAAQAQSPVVPTPPGKLVDIGGQRLHLYCTGRGSPTVLLESGTGDVSVIWSLVQPDVSKFTRDRVQSSSS
jgi:hypothetical protein